MARIDGVCRLDGYGSLARFVGSRCDLEKVRTGEEGSFKEEVRAQGYLADLGGSSVSTGDRTEEIGDERFGSIEEFGSEVRGGVSSGSREVYLSMTRGK